MKHRINYTANAKRDLEETWDHITSELQNISAADRVVNSILDDVDQLARFPELGALLSSISEISSDYRFLVCGKYLVFYRVFENEIRVDRILYGRRNYLNILFGGQMSGQTEP